MATKFHNFDELKSELDTFANSAPGTVLQVELPDGRVIELENQPEPPAGETPEEKRARLRAEQLAIAEDIRADEKFRELTNIWNNLDWWGRKRLFLLVVYCKYRNSLRRLLAKLVAI